MAHIKQNVLGVLQGKVGTLSAYSNGTGNVARIRTNATNVGESASRTKKQQSNRVRWANMVNFYKASKAWMPKAFENKPKNRSDYNQFMSVNYVNSRAALTKSEATAGACIVEGFLISQGSLAPVQVQKHENHWDTNLALGELTISEATTVAELSTALITANNFLRAGMQLSFVSYQQIVDDLGTPRVICTAYELILDPTNTMEKAMSYLPEFCLASSEGFLATGDDISVGGFAYVLSETIGGRTLVSTQSIILNNDTLLEKYTSEEQQLAAMQSYGLTANVFLDSDKADTKQPTPQPQFIVGVMNATAKELIPTGGEAPTLQTMFGTDASQQMVIRLAVPVSGSDVTGAELEHGSSQIGKSLNVVKVEGTDIYVKLNEGGSFLYDTLNYVSVELKGVEVEADFEY